MVVYTYFFFFLLFIPFHSNLCIYRKILVPSFIVSLKSVISRVKEAHANAIEEKRIGFLSRQKKQYVEKLRLTCLVRTENSYESNRRILARMRLLTLDKRIPQHILKKAEHVSGGSHLHIITLTRDKEPEHN